MNRLCDRTEAQAWHPPERAQHDSYHGHIIAAAVIACAIGLAVLIWGV